MRLDYLLQAHAYATSAERLPLKRAQQRIRSEGLHVDGTLVRDPKHQVVPGVEAVTDARGAALEVESAFCLLNKPAGHVSQRHPTEPNVYDLIPPHLARPDLAAFGRLDRDTTGALPHGHGLSYLLPTTYYLLPTAGMLLFGTDGGVQSLLLSPASRVWKTYIVP